MQNQAAAIATPEDAGGLDPVLFIAEQAKVMQFMARSWTVMEHQVQ